MRIAQHRFLYNQGASFDPFCNGFAQSLHFRNSNLPRKPHKEWCAYVTKLRYELNFASDNLKLAQRYWASISGEDGYDVRNGRRAVDTFRDCAVKSDDGLAAMLSALRKLTEDCGEFPRSYLFDPLIENVIRSVARNANHPLHTDATWLIDIIDNNS